MEELPSLQTPQTANARDIELNKDIAALSYAWVLSVFIYVFRRHSAFVRFHARQGMVLFALSVVFWFVPVIGRILEIFVLLFVVVGFVSAIQGQWRQLPLVYPISSGNWKAMSSSSKDLMDMVRSILKGVRSSSGATPPSQAQSSQQQSSDSSASSASS